MPVAVVTGSAGLVGSEATRMLAGRGLAVHGIDNDMRRHYFGEGASTAWRRRELEAQCRDYAHHSLDIRDRAGVDRLFRHLGSDIRLVIHAAAQPSHDWAAREPVTDFAVNATGTLNLLEAVRQHCPEAVFIFLSTNKVYGDAPNRLPLIERATRWEIAPGHPYAEHGIDEGMSVDQSLHSLFGASKLAADMLVQEYGRYFGMKTAVFRGGCLTGPAHSGTELHGFLAYLVKCVVAGSPYRVHGYKAKQVRDNIHAADLVEAFWAFFCNPRCGEVYNIGGGRFSNCSMLEAIDCAEAVTGRKLNWSLDARARIGDHVWWVSDVRKFQRHFPEWRPTRGIRSIIEEIALVQERALTADSAAVNAGARRIRAA